MFSNTDLTLEFPDQPESNLLGSLQSILDIEEEGFQQKWPNLIEVPENLWATFNTIIGRMKRVEPIKIQIDIAKPLPKLPQYPLKPKAIQGLIPIVEDLIAQRLIISCINSCNKTILPLWTPNGQDDDLSRIF